MQAGINGEEIKPLTSFRFIAVCAVFFSHLPFFADHTELKYLYDRFLSEGYTGVTFFFVLSGFILTYKYHAEFSPLTWAKLKAFYVSRVARIWPVHLLTFLVFLPIVYAQGSPQEWISAGRVALLNVLLLQSLVPDIKMYYSFNSPSWSLSDEAFFYALFPILLLPLIRLSGTSIRRASILGLGTWLIPFLIVYAFRNVVFVHWSFYISPFFRLFDFLLGVMVCLAFLRIRKTKVSAKMCTLLEFAGLVGLSAALYFSSSVEQAFRYGVYYTPFISFVILVFAFQKGYLSSLLSHRVAVLLGEISFSFYLFHALIIRFVEATDIVNIPLLAAATAFALSLCVSYICFRVFESPARKRIRQFILGHRPRAYLKPV